MKIKHQRLAVAALALLTLPLAACSADEPHDQSADSQAASVDPALLERATARYTEFVSEETQKLVAGTQDFVRAYQVGDDDAARDLYATTRTHWERIEPVAESFGDLDPRMDLREADLAEGEEWTGWHLLEKDLWPPAAGYERLTAEEREEYSERLLADTHELEDRVEETSYSAEQIGNGAKELLDEVANGKVTGEEEIWSHTDLYDFQANVDGARMAFDVLRPTLHERDADLERALEQRFDDLQELLDRHRRGQGFISYDDLTMGEVRELSDAVNALSEPLSQLTAAVAG
jgi:iron uptake system component EfeO